MEQNQKHGPTPKNEGNYLGSHVYKSQNEGWGTRCLPHGLRVLAARAQEKAKADRVAPDSNRFRESRATPWLAASLSRCIAGSRH